MRVSLLEYFQMYPRQSRDIAYVQSAGYRTERFTYGEIARYAFQLARELESRHIRNGDRVMIWAENSAEWVIAFFGCLLRGAIVVPMDHIASPDFALRVCRQVEAKLLIAPPGHDQNGLDCPVINIDELRTIVAKHSSDPYAGADVGPDHPVEIVFTSGTTADPKGVVISHRNVLASLLPIEQEVKRYIKYERPFHPLRFLNLLPLSHVFGQFLAIFIPQILRATVIFQSSFNPSEIVHAIKRERVSVLVTVPRLMETLRDKVEREVESNAGPGWLNNQLAAAQNEHFLKRWWRFRAVHRMFGWKFWAFVCGGASLDFDTESFWGRLGFAVVQGYGLTETTSLVSLNHPFKLARGSIGKVLPGSEIKLDDNGEILVRGANVASGYWIGTELKPVQGGQGWFRTGDMGELDDAGHLYFKGRKKNVIVTPEGMNVYPEDLEAALRRQPEVRDCVVVPVNREGVQEPCAALILHDPTAAGEGVVNRANGILADYQRIRHWFMWPEDDFPRTSTQKPRLNEIKEVAESQIKYRGSNQTQTHRSTALAGLIEAITGKPLTSVPANARLAQDLNLNSIDRVELMAAMEDRFQVEINEGTFTEASTIADLEKMLHQPSVAAGAYSYPKWSQRWPTTWLRFAAYYALTWPATFLLARPRVVGRTDVRNEKGPVLVISNHVSMVDVGFVLWSLPPRLRHRLAVAMAGERLRLMRNPPRSLGFFARSLERFKYVLVVSLFNVFPLPQESGFRESFKFAGESVDRGYSVLVFPEGARTPDGTMKPFRSGIGLLVQKLDLPVIPARIDGLFELRETRKRFARPGTVKVSIGTPLRFEADQDPTRIAETLYDVVASLDTTPD